MGNNFLPVAPLNFSIVNLNKLTRGSAPDALPPITFSLAPAGLTLDTSHVGIIPEYNKATNSLYAFAHPVLLSSTVITTSDSCMFSLMIGSLSTFSLSTENPTPVPHIRMYIASSNDLGLSTGR